MGRGAVDFLDFLYQAGQTRWQILPLGPTSGAFSHSPYMSPSAFAGNPLLISPERLVTKGLLKQGDLENTVPFSEYSVDFVKVVPFKEKLLS
ncbi:MAG TPA: 4-alpha-glucanotransferase, partial [Thermodesulfobacteriaceae bacterium]|nr:4-alpha-glucanotransferase [Thermodesulfobacteriaceae bacterium]